VDAVRAAVPDIAQAREGAAHRIVPVPLLEGTESAIAATTIAGGVPPSLASYSEAEHKKLVQTRFFFVNPFSPRGTQAQTGEMVSEEETAAGMESRWRHYGVAGLIFGIGGTIYGIATLTQNGSESSREMAIALLVLCPLVAALAAVSLTIARKMRAEAVRVEDERSGQRPGDEPTKKT
jgi:hypothetical protein